MVFEVVDKLIDIILQMTDTLDELLKKKKRTDPAHQSEFFVSTNKSNSTGFVFFLKLIFSNILQTNSAKTSNKWKGSVLLLEKYSPKYQRSKRKTFGIT